MEKKALAELLSDESIKHLAIPSNIRLGTQLFSSGAVEVIERGPVRVAATVEGPVRRKVMLEATDFGLQWSCTCRKELARLCKHCIAVGLAVR